MKPLGRPLPCGFEVLIGVGLILTVFISAGAGADERVDITAMDGAQLIGDLAGTSGPGVVLTHGQQSDRRALEAVANAIAGRGFRTLRFDLRGHGDSAGPADLAASDRDIEGAYRYLLGRKIRPVFLVGAGIGGTASLIVATHVPVAGVVTLGFPPTYQTLEPRSALSTLRVPVLSLMNEADPDAKGSAPLLGSSRMVTVSDPDVLSSSQALAAIVEFLSNAQGAIAAKTP